MSGRGDEKVAASDAVGQPHVKGMEEEEEEAGTLVMAGGVVRRSVKCHCSRVRPSSGRRRG